MLDKKSKEVLKFILAKYNSASNEEIPILASDVGMKYPELNTLCKHLKDQGCLSNYWFTIHSEIPVRVQLSHYGLHYFEYERIENLSILKKSVLVPVIVTLLTQLLLFLLKQLWQPIQELLQNIL